MRKLLSYFRLTNSIIITETTTILRNTNMLTFFKSTLKKKKSNFVHNLNINDYSNTFFIHQKREVFLNFFQHQLIQTLY